MEFRSPQLWSGVRTTSRKWSSEISSARCQGFPGDSGLETTTKMAGMTTRIHPATTEMVLSRPFGAARAQGVCGPSSRRAMRSALRDAPDVHDRELPVATVEPYEHRQLGEALRASSRPRTGAGRIRGPSCPRLDASATVRWPAAVDDFVRRPATQALVTRVVQRSFLCVGRSGRSAATRLAESRGGLLDRRDSPCSERAVAQQLRSLRSLRG